MSGNFLLENIKITYSENYWPFSVSLTIHITFWSLRNSVDFVYDKNVSHMLPKKKIVP